MPQVHCHYCGLPFKLRQVEEGRRYFCCSGCALASKLPPGGIDGRYPIVPILIGGLVVGLAYFNQVLFWSLALEIAREGRGDTADTFARLSAALGVFVWLGLAAGLWRAARRRWADALVTATTLAFVVAAFHGPLSAGNLVGANTALGLWTTRGWSKRNIKQKASLPV